MVQGLIDMGAALAQALQVAALAEAEAAPVGERVAVLERAAAGFDLLARSVRRSVVLLLLRWLERPETGMAVTDMPAARRRVVRAVEDAIGREHGGSVEGESLQAELLERLDRPELADELGCRPVDAVILDICRDLGLCGLPGTRPWKRRRPADVAALHARAAEGREGARPRAWRAASGRAALATRATALTAVRVGRAGSR